MSRVLLFFGVLLFGSLTLTCAEEPYPKPEDLIPEDTYIKLMVDVQLFDALVYTSDSLSNSDSLRNALFHQYDTTEDVFLRSHYYYQSNIRKHNARLDSALNALAEEKKKLYQSSDSNNK